MRYVVPSLILACTILAFFRLARGRFREFGVSQFLLRILVALPLLASGVLMHFLRVEATASMIPPAVPFRRFLVLLTGVLEILGAVGLFVPALRRPAALWIAILMVAVFPANVYVAGHLVGGIEMPTVAVRLAMQIGYVVLILLSGYGLPGIGTEGTTLNGQRQASVLK